MELSCASCATVAPRALKTSACRKCKLDTVKLPESALRDCRRCGRRRRGGFDRHAAQSAHPLCCATMAEIAIIRCASRLYRTGRQQDLPRHQGRSLCERQMAEVGGSVTWPERTEIVAGLGRPTTPMWCACCGRPASLRTRSIARQQSALQSPSSIVEAAPAPCSLPGTARKYQFVSDVIGAGSRWTLGFADSSQQGRPGRVDQGRRLAAEGPQRILEPAIRRTHGRDQLRRSGSPRRHRSSCRHRGLSRRTLPERAAICVEASTIVELPQRTPIAGAWDDNGRDVLPELLASATTTTCATSPT